MRIRRVWPVDHFFRSRVRVWCAAALLLPSVAPWAAWAQQGAEEVDSQDSEVREIESLDQATLDRAEGFFFSALGHYQKKEYDLAAQNFQKAYDLTQHRDLLYNLARCQEHLGNKEAAVDAYLAYLATSPTDETAIIHRVRELGGEERLQKALAGAAEKKSNGAQVAGPVRLDEIKGSGTNIWPWVVGGTGLVALGVGTVFGLQALDAADNARSADLYKKAKENKEKAESRATLANITIGIGAAALVGAAALWFFSDSEEPAATSRLEVGFGWEAGPAMGLSGRF